jgi:hypothetical protein
MGGRFDISALCSDAQTIARVVRAEDVFGLLTREVALPAQCAALLWGASGGPSCVGEGGVVSAADAREILFVRTATFPLSFEIDSLRSSDGFDCGAAISLGVLVIADKSELVAFSKRVMGSHSTVGIARITAICEQAVRTVAATVASSRTVVELTSPPGSKALADEIDKAVTPLGFECGLAFSKDVRASFSSRDHAESRRIAASAELGRQRLGAQESLRQAEATLREKHLASLAGVLEKVRAMSAKSGGLRVADLVKTFDAAQRGELYGALMAMDAPTMTSRIVVAAGEEVIAFDPGRPSEIVARQALSDELGPLRSVRVSERDGGDVLLVGARTGVHLIGLDFQPKGKYSFASDKSLKHGVNAAVIVGEWLYATHSESGLIRWSLTKDAAEFVLSEITRGAKSVRDVQLDDRGRLWLAAGDEVITVEAGASSPGARLNAGAEVSVLSVADRFAHAGLADGRIVRWPVDGGDEEVIRGACGRRVESLEWLAGGGVPRVLVADRQTHLDLLVAGDSYRGEYRAPHGVRWGLAAGDWIVGVSETRDRLSVWNRKEPREPAAVIHVARACGELIEDVVILDVGST